jgi:hypothetical protein
VAQANGRLKSKCWKTFLSDHNGMRTHLSRKNAQENPRLAQG